MSDSLREYYQFALGEEKQNYEAYQAALKATPDAKPNLKKFLTDFDLYTLYMPMREQDAAAGLLRAKMPANWVLESCFRKAVAAYQSFFTLVKHGDPDARPPKATEEWRFTAIQGALNASSVKGNRLVLAPTIFPGALEFEIPKAYQAGMLARSQRFAKFVISRDESDLRKPGRLWVSVSYEIHKPETQPFVPEEAVFIALGASSIGVVSPRGEEVIPLWRSDKHWKPLTDSIDESLAEKPTGTNRRPLTRGSKKWRKLEAKRRKMFRIMGAQQTQNRREVATLDLIDRKGEADVRLQGHGVHFVVSELVVRSKDGKLADSGNKGRSGPLGLNWSAQNTGTIGYLAHWLEAKVAEYGGTVRKHKLSYEALPHGLPEGHENKILMARALRDDFLKSFSTGEAA